MAVIACCLWLSPACAQRRLAIESQFDGSKPYYETATRVWVEGKELKPYKLTLYKSITVKENPEAFADMETAVMADTLYALSKELGHIQGRLYYAFICLRNDTPHRQRPGHYRYVFYRNLSLRKGGSPEATIVYMDGTTTMDGLKQLFKRK